MPHLRGLGAVDAMIQTASETPAPPISLPLLHGVRFGVPIQESNLSPLWGIRGASIGPCLAAIALFCCCSQAETPEKTSEPEGPAPGKQLFLGPREGASGAKKPALPDLPKVSFVQHSRGLAVGGTWREHPLLHDFNGDGNADMVASNREEDGLNTWIAPTSEGGDWSLVTEGLPRDLMYGGSDAGDLDGDGDPDLVFGSHLDGLRVFLNGGELQWTESPSEHDNPFRMLDVCLGNLNADEHLDVVGIGHFSDSGAGVFLGLGDGTFRRAPESETIFEASTFGTVIELSDLDGDGDDDLFFCCKAGPRVFLTEQTEEGLTWTPSSAGLPTTSIGNIVRACLPADLNGDGTPELVVGELTDPNMSEDLRRTAAVYSFDQANARWDLVDSGLPTHLSVTDAASADLDGDGHADIVLVSIEEGVMIYRGDGTLRFTSVGQVSRAPNPRVALGDANGDGRVDICMLHGATKSNPDGGGVQVFLNTAMAWTER